jgi:prevent-host-death family protein
MQRYSIADARTHLPAIVDKAEAGLKVELTRRGKPVAIVVSLREFERLRSDRPQFSELYRHFLKRYPLEDVGVDADFAKSIRNTSVGRKVSL